MTCQYLPNAFRQLLNVKLNFPFLSTHEIHLICRDFQTDPSTIRASWDVSGDPCPPVKYEWAIRRLDGHEISSFFSTNSKYCKNYPQIMGEGVNSSNFCCIDFCHSINDFWRWCNRELLHMIKHGKIFYYSENLWPDRWIGNEEWGDLCQLH